MPSSSVACSASRRCSRGHSHLLVLPGNGPTPVGTKRNSRRSCRRHFSVRPRLVPDIDQFVVPGGWLIAVEMTFYLILPWCFGALEEVSVDRLQRACSSSACRSSSASPPGVCWPGSSGRPARAVHDAIGFHASRCVFPGVVLFFLIKRFGGMRQSGSSSAERLTRFIPEVSLLLVFSLALVSERLPLAYFWFSSAFVLLAFGLSVRPIWLLVNPLTRYVGKVSFSAYITHFMVIESVGRRVSNAVGRTDAGANAVVNFAVTYVVCCVATVLASSLTYFLIEAPGQNVGRAALRWLGYGSAPALIPAGGLSVEKRATE